MTYHTRVPTRRQCVDCGTDTPVLIDGMWCVACGSIWSEEDHWEPETSWGDEDEPEPYEEYETA